MSTKVCKTCKIELELNHNNFKSVNGGKYFSNDCRKCMNRKASEAKARKKGIEYKPRKSTGYTIDGNTKPEYKIERNFVSVKILMY